MKSILAGVVLMAITGQAKDDLSKVTVCLSYQSAELQSAYRAKYVASQIYKQIGVKIEWTICNDKRTEDVRVRFVSTAPRDVPENAFAYALPYEGKTVEIFSERVRAKTHSFLGDLLGHILAHEIAHILQGIARHSESGVLKANWTVGEKEEMSYRPMQFTAYDAELIHTGINARASARASVQSATNAVR